MSRADDITPLVRDWLHEPVTLSMSGAERVARRVHTTRQQRAWLSGVRAWLDRRGRGLGDLYGDHVRFQELVVATPQGGRSRGAQTPRHRPAPRRREGARPSVTVTRLIAVMALLAAGSGAVVLTGQRPTPALTLETTPVEPGVERVVSDGIREIEPPGGPGEAWFDHNLAAGPDGSVWVFEDGQSFYRLGIEGTLTQGPDTWLFTDVEVAPDGTLWAADREADLRRFDGDTWVPVRVPGVPGVAAVEIPPDGSVWVSNGLAVSRFAAGEWTSLRAVGMSPPERGYPWPPDNFVVTSRGEAWLTWTGPDLVRFDGDGWQTVRPVEGGFSLIAADVDGGLWGAVGGIDTDPITGRFAHFDGDTWVYLGAEGQAPGPVGGFYTGGIVPGFLAVGPDGALWRTARDPWVANEWNTCGGLTAFDGETWTAYLRDTCIYALDIAPDGTVWTITPGGLYRIRPWTR